MIRGPLPDRLEFAILQIVMKFSDGRHQTSWGSWRNEVTAQVPDLTGDELKAAFTRLWRHHHISLSKWTPNNMSFVEYSGRLRS
jgi:hypothetical protein